MDEEGNHAGTPDLTGKLYYRNVMKACMSGQGPYQMLDEDARYREGAKDIQVGAMAHKPSTILPYYPQSSNAGLAQQEFGQRVKPT